MPLSTPSAPVLLADRADMHITAINLLGETRRLVIDDQGTVSVYDTGSHRIFGVAQAQSADRTLTFTGQDGLVRIADLPKVSV
jgi:hypothetical protein